MKKLILLAGSVALGIISSSFAATCELQGKTLVISGNGTITDSDCSKDDKSQATAVIFAEGSNITSIGAYAFRKMSGFTNLVIPDSVKTIGGESFWGANGLTSITLPESLIRIDNYAFMYATALKSITIPDSTSIGSNAFCNTYHLNEIIISDGWEDGGITLDDKAFAGSCFSSLNRPNSCSNNAKIVCQGSIEKCKTALAKFGGNGNCTVDYCIDSNKIVSANEEQCSGAKYYWSGASCNNKKNGITCAENWKRN